MKHDLLIAIGVLSVSTFESPALAKEIRLTLREGTNFAAAQSTVDGSFFLDLQGTLWRLPKGGGKAAADIEASEFEISCYLANYRQE